MYTYMYFLYIYIYIYIHIYLSIYLSLSLSIYIYIYIVRLLRTCDASTSAGLGGDNVIFKIHQRGVQWKRGVVICMVLYAILL